MVSVMRSSASRIVDRTPRIASFNGWSSASRKAVTSGFTFTAAVSHRGTWPVQSRDARSHEIGDITHGAKYAAIVNAASITERRAVRDELVSRLVDVGLFRSDRIRPRPAFQVRAVSPIVRGSRGERLRTSVRDLASGPLGLLVVLVLVLVAVLAVREVAELIVPVIFGLFLALLAMPAVRSLQRRG